MRLNKSFSRFSILFLLAYIGFVCFSHLVLCPSYKEGICFLYFLIPWSGWNPILFWVGFLGKKGKALLKKRMTAILSVFYLIFSKIYGKMSWRQFWKTPAFCCYSKKKKKVSLITFLVIRQILAIHKTIHQFWMCYRYFNSLFLFWVPNY